MGNVNENRVDITIADTAMQRIDDACDDILNSIPDVSLTDEERNSMVSMDVDNKVFADDVWTEIQGPARNIIPAYVDTARYRNDLTLAEQADAISAKLAVVVRRVSDLHRIASSETMATASLVYNLILAANKAGVSGAKEPAEKLKRRYKQSRRTDEPEV